MGRKLLLHHWYRNNYNSHHVQRCQSLIITSTGCLGHSSLYCNRKASYIPRMLLRNDKGVLVLLGFSFLNFFFQWNYPSKQCINCWKKVRLQKTLESIPLPPQTIDFLYWKNSALKIACNKICCLIRLHLIYVFNFAGMVKDYWCWGNFLFVFPLYFLILEFLGLSNVLFWFC